MKNTINSRKKIKGTLVDKIFLASRFQPRRSTNRYRGSSYSSQSQTEAKGQNHAEKACSCEAFSYGYKKRNIFSLSILNFNLIYPIFMGQNIYIYNMSPCQCKC